MVADVSNATPLGRVSARTGYCGLVSAEPLADGEEYLLGASADESEESAKQTNWIRWMPIDPIGSIGTHDENYIEVPNLPQLGAKQKTTLSAS